ncbi:MAG TPA: hypothetical protein VHD35_10220 [Chitinophagaceae bacterium]|nr:hypothetical protein [Chitinophagaceae bacterium]
MSYDRSQNVIEAAPNVIETDQMSNDRQPDVIEAAPNVNETEQMLFD